MCRDPTRDKLDAEISIVSSSLTSPHFKFCVRLIIYINFKPLTATPPSLGHCDHVPLKMMRSSLKMANVPQDNHFDTLIFTVDTIVEVLLRTSRNVTN